MDGHQNTPCVRAGSLTTCGLRSLAGAAPAGRTCLDPGAVLGRPEAGSFRLRRSGEASIEPSHQSRKKDHMN